MAFTVDDLLSGDVSSADADDGYVDARAAAASHAYVDVHGADEGYVLTQDAHCPTWNGTVQGQINLYHTVRRTITFQDKGKQYKLRDGKYVRALKLLLVGCD